MTKLESDGFVVMVCPECAGDGTIKVENRVDPVTCPLCDGDRSVALRPAPTERLMVAAQCFACGCEFDIGLVPGIGLRECMFCGTHGSLLLGPVRAPENLGP